MKSLRDFFIGLPLHLKLAMRFADKINRSTRAARSITRGDAIHGANDLFFIDVDIVRASCLCSACPPNLLDYYQPGPDK